jgi:hypothetical protein
MISERLQKSREFIEGECVKAASGQNLCREHGQSGRGAADGGEPSPSCRHCCAGHNSKRERATVLPYHLDGGRNDGGWGLPEGEPRRD